MSYLKLLIAEDKVDILIWRVRYSSSTGFCYCGGLPVSSLFSSFGGAPTSFCQRCRNPLPPNIVQCGYCGYDNSPVQRNDLTGDVPSSSQTSWNVYPLQNGNIPPDQHNNMQ